MERENKCDKLSKIGKFSQKGFTGVGLLSSQLLCKFEIIPKYKDKSKLTEFLILKEGGELFNRSGMIYKCYFSGTQLLYVSVTQKQRHCFTVNGETGINGRNLLTSENCHHRAEPGHLNPGAKGIVLINRQLGRRYVFGSKGE